MRAFYILEKGIFPRNSLAQKKPYKLMIDYEICVISKNPSFKSYRYENVII